MCSYCAIHGYNNVIYDVVKTRWRRKGTNYYHYNNNMDKTTIK